MTTYNTGNPVGSPDPRDLYDNAENLDEAINSTSDEWTDRLGRTRFTIEGVTNLATDLGTAAYRDTVGLGDVYAREGIIGTVSQSNGIPTGAIIERGSNSNGEYVKFADGTAIITKNRVILEYDGAKFVRDSSSSFPISLIDRDYSISYSFRPSDSNGAAFNFADDATPGADEIGQVAFRKTLSECPIRVARIFGMTDFQPGDLMYMDLTITGRWY